MPIETIPIQTIKLSESYSRSRAFNVSHLTVAEVAEEITAVYKSTIEHGGKVIGSHVLTVISNEFDFAPKVLSHQEMQVLFLVAEMPDEHNEVG